MLRLILAAVIAAIPIAAVAATVTPSAIMASPSTFDGQTVTVTGTVQNFVSKTTEMGNFARFQLCDAKCINVIDKTNQSHSSGATATITGVFHVSFKAPKKTWADVVLIQ